MYRIAHKELKLDGVITEFSDIYAPLANIWEDTSDDDSKPSLTTEEATT